MKNLLEIIQAVRAGGKKDEDILAYFLPKNSLNYRFVAGLCALRWKTDKEAIDELYPGTSKSNNGKYRQLKSSIRHKLLDILLDTVPEGKAKNSIEAKAKIMKLLSAGYILFSRNAVNSGAELLAQAETLSIEYEFTTHAFMAINPLEGYYAVIGDTKSAEESGIKKQRYLEEIQARSKTQQLYKTFANITNTTSDYTKEIIDEVEEVSAKLAELAELYPKYDMIMPAKRASVYTSIMKRDFTSALQTCQSILQYFDEHPTLLNPTGYYTTLGIIALCHKELFHYQEALEFNKKVLEQTQSRTSSWEVNILSDVDIALRAGDLARAYDGLNQVLEFQSSGGTREMLQEQAVLLHGFFVIAVKSRYYTKSVPKEWIDLADKFDMDAMINQAPVVFKDKAGYNTARVILQVLLFIAVGQFTSAASRETALVQYRSKYVDKHTTPRTYALFKLLLLIIECKFDMRSIQKLAKPLTKKLEPSAENYMGTSEGLEPIEYRILWKMIIAMINSHTQKNTIN